MELKENKVYYARLSESKFGNLDSKELSEVYSDGRYVSPLIERFMGHNFDNISYVHGNKSYDFVYNNGASKPLEARGLPSEKKFANLIPSNMIGAGRFYNEAKYLEKLNSISGFLMACSLKNYRHLLVFMVPSVQIINTIPLQHQFLRKDVPAFLGASLEQIGNNLLNNQTISFAEDQFYEFDRPWKNL